MSDAEFRLLEEVERIIARMLGYIHVALGIAVQAGGPERFPSPNYDVLLRVSDGYVWPYGLAWIAGGVLMVFPFRVQVRCAGMVLIVILANIWAALFGIAAYEDPTASFTPTAAYGGYALLNAVLLWLTWMHTRKINEEE